MNHTVGRKSFRKNSLIKVVALQVILSAVTGSIVHANQTEKMVCGSFTGKPRYVISCSLPEGAEVNITSAECQLETTNHLPLRMGTVGESERKTLMADQPKTTLTKLSLFGSSQDKQTTLWFGPSGENAVIRNDMKFAALMAEGSVSLCQSEGQITVMPSSRSDSLTSSGSTGGSGGSSSIEESYKSGNFSSAGSSSDSGIGRDINSPEIK